MYCWTFGASSFADAGHISGIVDHGVPLSIPKGVQAFALVWIAIAQERFDTREQSRPGTAAIEQGRFVPARLGRFDGGGS